MFESLQEYVYPSLCPLCREAVTESILVPCEGCQSSTSEFCGPHCRLCGAKSDTVFDICTECLQCVRPWDRGSSVLPHKGHWRQSVQAFKYQGQVWLLPYLSRCLYKHWQENLSEVQLDGIAAVPLHWFKKWRRGYNQSALLAQQMSQMTGLPYIDCLSRRRYGRAQAHLNRKERQQNISDVFRLKLGKQLRGINILLIDDVLTTGATLSACTHCLLEGGAGSVVILTLSRG